MFTVSTYCCFINLYYISFLVLNEKPNSCLAHCQVTEISISYSTTLMHRRLTTCGELGFILHFEKKIVADCEK